jgi:hypothetical protein
LNDTIRAPPGVVVVAGAVGLVVGFVGVRDCGVVGRVVVFVVVARVLSGPAEGPAPVVPPGAVPLGSGESPTTDSAVRSPVSVRVGGCEQPAAAEAASSPAAAETAARVAEGMARMEDRMISPAGRQSVPRVLHARDRASRTAALADPFGVR